MKQIILRGIAMASLLATALTFNSCIYESPVDDEFYRTLWESSEAPFEELTLEFLCDSGISVQAANAAGSFGTYDYEGFSAYFTEVRLTLANDTIIFEKAHRSDDTLTLIWHYVDSGTTYATQMIRLSAYK